MADRATSVRNGLSHGSRGPELLMQWVHSRLHHVPVIWIQSVEKRRNGATGTWCNLECTHCINSSGPSSWDDHGKMLSGMKADTIQLGASTISLILRSAATLQMM